MKSNRQIFGILSLSLVSLINVNGQEVTASFVDDLNTKEEKATLTFNKKVKLTNDNGKSVVLRINDRVKTNDNSKVAVLSKNTEKGAIVNGKGKVKIQEIADESDEIERFWATADASISSNMNVSPAFKTSSKSKEVEIETTKIEGFVVNHIYDLKGNLQELAGYGLQLAAFTQLKTAKEFAEKIAKKGDAESEKIFIQVSKADDKPMIYRVLYGLFDSETVAKDSQKKMANLGLDALVKGFN